MINLDNLSSTEFEEFCYDLLLKMGFKNLSWRKGTGKSTSPSDSGRDIEAELFETEIDRKIRVEKYFIECKHYIEGVPPTAIEGALSWANAERPNVLLVIVSNYLSNPCKDYLKKYEISNRPAFRIKLWENKDIELLLSNSMDIYKKYRLEIDEIHYQYINKFHLAYVSKPKMNSLKYFFQVADSYDPEKRDSILSLIYLEYIKPRMKSSVTGQELVGDLIIDPIDYESFKKIILGKKDLETPFVHMIISEALAMAYNGADISETNTFIFRTQQMLEFAKEKLKVEKDPVKIDTINGIIKTCKEQIEKLPMNIKKGNEVYNDFCNNVVADLLAEIT